MRKKHGKKQDSYNNEENIKAFITLRTFVLQRHPYDKGENIAFKKKKRRKPLQNREKSTQIALQVAYKTKKM